VQIARAAGLAAVAQPLVQLPHRIAQPGKLQRAWFRTRRSLRRGMSPEPGGGTLEWLRRG
jgi:hypothetical protein